MTLSPHSELHEVHGIDVAEKVAIKAFLQGAVYCWIKNRKDEKFALRDLVGGENFDWNRTPLFALYNKHVEAGKDNSSAIKDAAKDAGWLLKKVLAEDKRTFELEKVDIVNAYRWVGGED